MNTVRTLVVEDEPRLAQAHRVYVQRIPGFEQAGVAHDGARALRLLDAAEAAGAPVDLVLLDMYLPDGHGLDWCRTMRGRGHRADVIAVTSARDVETVRAAVSLGVVQYLIKPFTFASFRAKLQAYARYRAELPGAAAGQHEVDRAFAALRGGGTGAGLPKGLSEDTLVRVLEHLRVTDGDTSAAELAELVGVSRVTGRRYLEHLVEQGRLQRTPRYGAAGRPEYGYRWVC